METEVEQEVGVLMRLEELFTEPSFMSEIEAYLNQHVASFTDSEDQPVENYRIFQNFSSLISAKLNDFVVLEATTEEAIFASLQKVFTEDSNSLTCFEYIFAACSYPDFLNLMLDRIQLLAWSSEVTL